SCFEPNVDDLRLPPRDSTMVLEPVVRPTPCIKSLLVKGGQMTSPVEHSDNSTSVSG
ncbi:hypothetical protein L195_g050406, partial [Trifolium pratense]